jgi:hypothetical protein
MADGNPYAGPAVGVFEDDQMQGHLHSRGNSSANCESGVARWGGVSTDSLTGPPITDGTNGDPRTGDETRPFAAGVTYIIKT